MVGWVFYIVGCSVCSRNPFLFTQATRLCKAPCPHLLIIYFFLSIRTTQETFVECIKGYSRYFFLVLSRACNPNIRSNKAHLSKKRIKGTVIENECLKPVRVYRSRFWKTVRQQAPLRTLEHDSRKIVRCASFRL